MSLTPTSLAPRPLHALRYAAMASAMTLCAAMPQAAAQDYPSRAIRVVLPFAAGAVSDIAMRILGERLTARLNVPIVVENQPGAGGIAAARAVLAAPPDGYTVAWLSNATAVSVGLFKKLPFDVRTDFVPVRGINDFEYLFVTNSASRFQSLTDFIAAARARPGSLNVGTGAAGSSNHLTALLFRSAAAVDFVVVPYKGPSELSVALLRNDLDLVVNAYGGLRQGIEQGAIRVLATSTTARFPVLPDVPTVEEMGVPDFDVSSWSALYAPAKTPPDVVAKLGGILADVLSEPGIATRFSDLGLTVRAITPPELDARMRKEIERWAKVIADAGIERQ